MASSSASIDSDSTINPLAVDFFNHLNMLYGTITEFCIPSEVRLVGVPAISR